MKRKTATRSVIVASIIAVMSGGLSSVYGPAFGEAQAGVIPPSKPTPPALANPSPSAAAAHNFSSIVERFGPAVVNISVIGESQFTDTFAPGPGLDPNDPFSQFYRRFGPNTPHRAPNNPMVQGMGSGFIISSDGMILTNVHVIKGAKEVTVKLTDRREYKAKVLGADPLSDVAVIKINAGDLPTVVLGNPTFAKVGEPVLAIGSPYGFKNTVTSGIISGKSRVLPNDTYVPFIQTDVAVNPGNSGGPLFNINGEVIGINSQIYSRTGGYQGLSFAIPIDVATKVQSQLVRYGKVTRGRLGISIQEVNQALAESFGLEKSAGALISAVEKGSPAEKAELRAGDVIVRLAGKPIDRSSDLPSIVADLKPGTAAQAKIIRRGSSKTLSVTVGEINSPAVAKAEDRDLAKERLGVAVRELNDDEKRQTGIPNEVLVERTAGPAARAGIQSGDVILALNGAPITNVDELRRLVDSSGKRVAMLVQRDNSRLFLPVEFG